MASSKIHISMDTETWGKRAGCDGRSIGATLFDPYRRRDVMNNIPVDRSSLGDNFYIALHNPLMGSYSSAHHTLRDLDKIGNGHRRYNLARDPSTVDWWHDQSEEAQAAFANPVDLKVGLQQFSDWLKDVGVDPDKDNACIWSHGAAYDPPIVEAWFHAVGLRVPWFYRAPRDTRTAFDMAAVGDHSKWMEKHQFGIKHHARDDSITAAYAINGAFNQLVF